MIDGTIVSSRRFAVTSDELANWCAEYDAFQGSYPKHAYEGASVFHFLMEKMEGRTLTNEEVYPLLQRYSPEHEARARQQRDDAMSKQRDEDEKKYDDPEYRARYIAHWKEMWGELKEGHKWPWDGGYGYEWYAERKAKKP